MKFRKKLLTTFLAFSLVIPVFLSLENEINYAATSTLPNPESANQGQGSGMNKPFNFDRQGSTIKDGEKEVPLNSLIMFRFDKAVSHPDIIAYNKDFITVEDETGQKLSFTVSSVPESISTPNIYSSRNEFNNAYRRYLSINIDGGLKENKNYKILLKSGISAKNRIDTTKEDYIIRFSTIKSNNKLDKDYNEENNDNNIIDSKSIKILHNNDLKFKKGDKFGFQVKINPINSSNKAVVWKSSNESIFKVDENGTIEAIGPGVATLIANIKGTDLSDSLVIEVLDNEYPKINSLYDDIENHWAKQNIIRLSKKNLFKGIEKNKFGPDEFMTRGMFVTVLGRLEKVKSQEKTNFLDVLDTAYYADSVSWAVQNGIIKGYEDGSFRPDNNISREEMASIISRYCEYKNIEMDIEKDIHFKDNDSISDWAKGSVYKAVKAKLIIGKNENEFFPIDFSTRAEVATILDRLISFYLS